MATSIPADTKEGFLVFVSRKSPRASRGMVCWPEGSGFRLSFIGGEGQIFPSIEAAKQAAGLALGPALYGFELKSFYLSEAHSNHQIAMEKLAKPLKPSAADDDRWEWGNQREDD